MDMALSDDTLTRFLASGVNAGLTLSAPPATYVVRLAVQDESGKMTTVNETLVLPM